MGKVITFGVFDYFHLGHLRLFKQCKKYGEYLIVAIQDDSCIKKYKPDAQILYSTKERIEIVSSISIVDEVRVYFDAGINDIQNIDFEVLALGEDQNHSGFIAMENWCYRNGKDVVRLKRTSGISSSSIKNELK